MGRFGYEEPILPKMFIR